MISIIEHSLLFFSILFCVTAIPFEFITGLVFSFFISLFTNSSGPFNANQPKPKRKTHLKLDKSVMTSQELIRFSKSTSYLVIFVLSPLLCYLPCASSKQELGWCEAPFQCGEITAGFPFWGGNRPEHCGSQSSTVGASLPQ